MRDQAKISPGHVAFPLMGRNFLHQWREKRFIIDEYSLFNPRYSSPFILLSLSLSLSLWFCICFHLSFSLFHHLSFFFSVSLSASPFLFSICLSFFLLLSLSLSLLLFVSLSSLRYFCFSLVSHHISLALIPATVHSPESSTRRGRAVSKIQKVTFPDG